MATPRSDAEWASHIASLKPTILSTQSSAQPHSIPPLAGTIDHTLLALTATKEQVTTLCTQAKAHHFASVCVRLSFAAHAASLLKDTPVRLAVVIGFHEGTDPTAAKVSEAQAAVAAGAHELDVVLNRGPLAQGRYGETFAELVALREAAPKAVLKLILETSRLDEEQVLAASVLAGEAGWDFVKTSTGFEGGGATVEHVRLMRAVCDTLGKGMKVKASGGVRTAKDARAMLEAGASRLGTSGGVGIVEDGQAKGEGY